jgi:hypothetical protein
VYSATRPGSPQLLHDLGAHLLVDLDDLQRGLGDLALRLGDAGDELAALALEVGGLRSSAERRVSWTRFLA